MNQLFRCILALSCIAIVNCPGTAQEDPSTTQAHGDTTSSESATIDPSGTWVWEQSFGGNKIGRELRLHFDDETLAGTYKSVSPESSNRPPGSDDPVVIEEARIVGDKISFAIRRKFNNTEFKMTFAGVIAGDEIAGVNSMNFGGQDREFAWMAKRVSDDAEVAEGSAAPKTQAPEQPASAVSPLLGGVAPARIPSPGDATDAPYQPRPILPGGIVIPLFDPESPHLNADRLREPEKYNLSGAVHGRINSIVNIHNPSIEVHFASPSMNTGSVVILAAGGGHRTLNVGTESADFVPYFYNFGVNTVILRNRLRSDGYEPQTDAVRDALQAIRLVRKHSEDWKLDSKRIGIMGFSAGAELSAPAAIEWEAFDKHNRDSSDPLAGVTSRPDFVGIIYPGPTPFTRQPDLEVPRNTPPAFITCAGAGDRIHAIWATDYFTAMLRAGIPNVEMHIYGNGYHPGDRGSTGGLTYRKGIPFGTWQVRFVDWFEDLGFLGPPGEETKAEIDSRNFVSQPPRRRPGTRRGVNRNR